MRSELTKYKEEFLRYKLFSAICNIISFWIFILHFCRFVRWSRKNDKTKEEEGEKTLSGSVFQLNEQYFQLYSQFHTKIDFNMSKCVYMIIGEFL